MKILIITVAGSSTRFSKSVGQETIKCLYHENDIEESLLYRMIHQPVSFDKYVIVGGYKYDELKNAINEWFSDLKDKIIVVQNPNYIEYGSGYSLYYGIKEAIKYNPDTITFAEGDLFIDSESFIDLYSSSKSVITYNHEPILSNKAVVLYFDINNQVHYIYDLGHSSLEIKEPFLSVYNSGQIWKFSNKEAFIKIYDAMKDEDWQGTNLVFVEKYFQEIDDSEINMIAFDSWVNCNTVDDFRKTIG